MAPRLLVVYLLLQALIVSQKRHGAKIALMVIVLSLALVGLKGVLEPFYSLPMSQALAILLVVLNLALFCVPVRWVARVSASTSTTWGSLLLLALPSTVLTIGGTEWLARLLTERGILKYATPVKTIMVQGSEDWRMKYITADEFREFDPVVFWRPVARTPYSRQRFKGPEIAVPKPRGTFRIMAYGDSNTDGPPKGAWAEQLQKILTEERAGGTRRYEVVNAGVAGYSSYQGLLRFREEVARYQPDLVFVSFGWNDLPPAVGFPDKAFGPPSRLFVAIQRALLQYRFYLVIRYYVGRRGPVATNGPRVSLSDYVANLHGFLDEAKRHHTSVVFLSRPHRLTIKALEAQAGWRSQVPSYNRALLEFAKRTGALAIDVEGEFDGRSDAFADECHFTLEGHQRMARLLLQAISTNHLLDQDE